MMRQKLQQISTSGFDTVEGQAELMALAKVDKWRWAGPEGPRWFMRRHRLPVIKRHADVAPKKFH